jgi:carboxymethylenebutenolidase
MAGLAYFISPLEGPGPGVLLLHSWFGLTSFVKRLADRIADEGFTVLAPDLLSGRLPLTAGEAETVLKEADPGYLATATLSAASVLSVRSAGGPMAVVGLGMGGSMGLWASTRAPELMDRVVSFYGTQNVDFDTSQSRYLLHLAEDDPWVTADDAAFMQATMGLEGLSIEVHRYPGTAHGFFEDGTAPAAADLAWQRTLSFLLPRGSSNP